MSAHEENGAIGFLGTNKEALPFVSSVVCIGIMMTLSSIGAVVGSVQSASSAAMVSNRSPDIVTRAYVPVLLSVAIFMYATVISFLALPKISMEMSGMRASRICAGFLIFGFVSLFVGISLGASNKKSIVTLSENRNFFLSFLILNSTMEIPAVFALIATIMLCS
ncbi:V-type H+-transporting ATPase 21kDa proteolipid subunit [Nematocida sp. LUAm3]|nr:V-type H+-transporting ATPase 21kDa proteolipid subunit [Nematocida sp. LUAm3]KAI5175779.1 V-type H+-transporting ATPase 21kDa proteolipid subunit [Nematocida sp. LUAm2]KAI5178275.1 V-type H+-transporting ATPase 21kDa proteolipid subunit [Nematocida sp. LUAm1]